MNELRLSDNLKAHLEVFVEQLQMLSYGDIFSKAEQKAAHSHPLTEEEKSLILDIYRKYVLQKCGCTTKEELEEKCQALRRQAETVGDMSFNANLKNDFKGFQQFADEAK